MNQEFYKKELSLKFIQYLKNRIKKDTTILIVDIYSDYVNFIIAGSTIKNNDKYN